MPEHEQYLAANRALWNCRTAIHLESDFYDLQSFEEGASSLRGPVVEEFSQRVSGRSVLHLQCHFGQDSLSLARLGADVTGVDFSNAAIDAARQLSDRLRIPATFVCSSVYDLSETLNQSFDYVYTSYGVLGWLPDLSAWAGVVHRMLKPGGLFYMVEFHPAFQQLDERGERKYAYFPSDSPDREIVTKTYTDGSEHAPLDEYWWNHPVSEPIDALIRSGLVLESFREYNFSPYKLAADMVEFEPSKWSFPSLVNQLPYLFSVEARRLV